MNRVELDPAALDAEADRILSDVPPDAATAAPDAPGGELQPPAGLGWLEVTPGLVAVADMLVLPQWGLRGEEKTALAEALAGVLDQLFPGGLGSEQWAPYFRLVAVGSAIAFSRIHPETGKLPPMGPMKKAEKVDDGKAAGDRQAA